ncbi:MAG: repair photolyase, partial [Haloplasmataceae bacterium]|nr:repair photolyase [Haloplasmataceae bacterium]
KETCDKHNIIYDVREVFDYMRVFEEKNNEVQIGFDI